MQFKIEKEVTTSLPDIKIGVLVARNIDNIKNADQTYQILFDQIEKTAQQYKNLNTQELPGANLWITAFTKLGFKFSETLPSHLALIKRIINREEISNISPLVNLLNTTSIKYKIPVGGHDLDKTEGDIFVGPNSKKLNFYPIGSAKTENVPPEEIIYGDAKSVHTRRWVWREGRKVMATDEIKNVFIPFDTLDKTDTELHDIALEIAGLLQKFCANSKTEFFFGIVSKTAPEIDLDKLTSIKPDPKIQVIATYPIRKDPEIIKALTGRAVEKVYPSKETLVNWLNSGRRLKVYQGFDPTADTLHIGHTAGMRKLRYFQQLGHEVNFLIGDFTGRIGDPTDKSSTRKKLTKEEVTANLKVYKEQASKILDLSSKENPVIVHFNSEWLEDMTFSDILEVSSEFTVQQMLKRDMFQKRLKEDRPIHLHEFLYPVMVAYDSVSMNIDVEVGGNDQTFNMLCGRDLTIKMLNKEKCVLSNKLLVDPSGNKMGKTEGNMVMLSDTPEDMYGKIMAFTDGMIVPAFELLTDVPLKEIEQMTTDMDLQAVNPMDLKKRLAYTITAEHKGKESAQKAQQYFESLFQNKETSSETLPKVSTGTSSIHIVELLVSKAHMAESNSKAKRLIEQGAVTLDGTLCTDKSAMIHTSSKGLLLRAGRQAVIVTE